MQNTMCATTIEAWPSVKPIAEKKISVATAVTISGTMMGREISAKLAERPRNAPPLTMPIAAAVAMVVAATAASVAMPSEAAAAARNLPASSPVNTSAYQRHENPPHAVIERLSLNE